MRSGHTSATITAIKNLRSFPLLVSFHGLPYIDVRVSFNSFVPRDVPDDLAGRLVNYYIDRLLAEPHLHDKVEFEIIFSCYTLDLPKRLACSPSTDSRQTTSPSSRALCGVSPIASYTARPALWRRDRAKIDLLAERLPTICNAEIDKISRIYWLIEDCKRYGTLPFAGLARAGFIAVQLLQSFVDAGVLSAEEHADIHGERRHGRLADRAGFRAASEGGVPRALRPSSAGHLRHPVAALRRGARSLFRLVERAADARPRRRASRSRSSSCAASSGCSRSTSSTSMS